VIPRSLLLVLHLGHFHLQKKSKKFLNFKLTKLIALNRKILIPTKELKSKIKISWTLLHLPLCHQTVHLIQTLSKTILRTIHQKLFYKRNLLKKSNPPIVNPPKTTTTITMSLNFQKWSILMHNQQVNLITAIQHHWVLSLKISLRVTATATAKEYPLVHLKTMAQTINLKKAYL